jgi:hypothetical protein
MTFSRKLQDKYRGGRRNEELEIYAVGKNVGKSVFQQYIEEDDKNKNLEQTIETAILKNLRGEDE